MIKVFVINADNPCGKAYIKHGHVSITGEIVEYYSQINKQRISLTDNNKFKIEACNRIRGGKPKVHGRLISKTTSIYVL